MPAALRLVKGEKRVKELDQMIENDDRSKDDAEAPRRAKHDLDSEKNQKRFNRLKQWFEQERERQAENRYQMAIDSDYYDNHQWKQDEAEDLTARGQAPLVFNEAASTIDWILGTERRTRVDFKVFPRTDDDVQAADIKTKTLKYLNDVNRVTFNRSAAFGDCVKVGLGWLEDGARTEPNEEVIYNRHQNWRHMWHDSMGHTLDDQDWRYVHRIRYVDADIARIMFKDRAWLIEEGVSASGVLALDEEESEDFWYLGKRFSSTDYGDLTWRGFLTETGMVDNRRERVKIIETRYRMPTHCFYVVGGPWDGQRFDHRNRQMVDAYRRQQVETREQMELRVWMALRTDKGLLAHQVSPFRHNSFGFTPLWCYRRGRDRLPYGVMRRIRDPQDDLNKRGSKTLFLLSTNRVIADRDAVEDHDEAREEVSHPDAYIIKKKGSEFTIDSHAEVAVGHMQLMDRDVQMIRNAGGVTNENLGRETNAESGEAIRARQLGGTVVTAEIFSNERFAIQTQGSIRLSLAEQYMTEARTLRITGGSGSRRPPELVKINQPVQDPDGTIRYLNDITSSQADFYVDEQDFAQSTRQAMFESMLDLIGKVAAINPEYALRLLRMALEFSDLPNKDEMADEVKRMLGITEPGDEEKLSPEERQALEQRRQQATEQAQIASMMMQLEVAEKGAEVKKLGADAVKITAEAEKISAEAQNLLTGADSAATAEHERQLAEIERASAEAIETATAKIHELMAKLANRAYEIDKKKETDIAVANINAGAKVEGEKVSAAAQSSSERAATEAKASDDAIMKKVDGLVRGIEDKLKDITAQFKAKTEGGAGDKEPTQIIVDSSGKTVADSPIMKAVSALLESAKQQQAAMADVAKALQQNTAKKPVAKVVTATLGGKTVKMRIEPETRKGAD